MFAAFASLIGPVAELPGEPDVQRLVRAARLGSGDAVRRLYGAHAARVYRAVRPWCGSDADAEDVTQDAFVDALTNLERYEARRGVRFIAWLVTLAMNRARKARARAGRLSPRDPPSLAALRDQGAGEPSPEETLLRRRALLEALAAVPERDRQVLSLYYGAELTAQEVGEVVGTSAANVRKICERRCAELQARLDPAGVTP